MASTINASVASNGIINTADASGILNIQSNGVNTNAQAWVNFNGTTSPGTIRAAYNVTSVTRSATGVYVLNFTNAFPNANYAVTAIGNNTSSGIFIVSLNGAPTTTTCPIQAYSTTANVNLDYIMCVIHG